MKYLEDQKLCVQLRDLRRLATSGKAVPPSIYRKYIKYKLWSIFFSDSTYITFSKQEDKDFLNGCPFILDYNDNRTLEQLDNEIGKLKSQIDDANTKLQTREWTLEELSEVKMYILEKGFMVKAIEELKASRQERSESRRKHIFKRRPNDKII